MTPAFPEYMTPPPHPDQSGSERPWWRQRWMMIAAGFSASFLVGVAYAAFIRRHGDWHEGTGWERRFLLATHVELPRALDALMLVLQWFGTNLTLIPVIGAAAIWLWWRRHRPHLAMHLIVVQLGSYLLNPALKALHDRTRPDLWERRGWYGWASYPSGHAICSVAVLMTVAILLHRERGWKWIYVVFVPLILASMWSRIYLGVHWPTDVIGGALVGGVWLFATERAFREGERTGMSVRPRDRRSIRRAA